MAPPSTQPGLSTSLIEDEEHPDQVDGGAIWVHCSSSSIRDIDRPDCVDGGAI